MKLWHGMTKRHAKKEMGRLAWLKLPYAANLKPGDLVSTCKGYNERIAEIRPEIGRTRRGGSYVCDFDIVSESGSSCSALHCCSFPLETREEIGEYFKDWVTPEALEWQRKWDQNGFLGPICQALLDGKAVEEIFDEDGQPRYEYCRDYERARRFPYEYLREIGVELPEGESPVEFAAAQNTRLWLEEQERKKNG